MLVVAAVIARGTSVLVCQRDRNGKFPLKWEFPGGKVQSGESPEAALARELREELGVEAKIGAEIFRTRHKYAEMPEAVELAFFRAAFPGEPQNRVFEKIAWINPDALAALDFLEADREFVAQLARGTVPCR